MDKKQIITISIIFAIAILGFLFFFNMTGNVITGAALNPEIEIHSFRISNFGMKINKEMEVINGTQNNSGSR